MRDRKQLHKELIVFYDVLCLNLSLVRGMDADTFFIQSVRCNNVSSWCCTLSTHWCCDSGPAGVRLCPRLCYVFASFRSILSTLLSAV